MLAGNRLNSLPDEMRRCRQLELLRLSSNRLTSLPDWLFDLPNLSWLALSGNPLSIHNNDLASSSRSEEVKVFGTTVSFLDLTLHGIVGEGASGVVHKATVKGSAALQLSDGSSIDPTSVLAVKLFKGAMTSDGSPENELEAMSRIGKHPNFIEVIGRLSDLPEGRQEKLGAVLPFVSQEDYHILGAPPSFETVTRDTFPPKEKGGMADAFSGWHSSPLQRAATRRKRSNGAKRPRCG